MTRGDGMTDRRDTPRDTRPDPWRALVTVSQIPDSGLHRDIEADGVARQTMADLAGLREIGSARASFDLTLISGGQVHVTGRVQAKVGQICVVTLDPIDNEIDEAVDLIFAPADQLPEFADLADDVPESEAEIADQPEPFKNGVIDLGRLATDVLLLAIDPYPRKPGVAFEPPAMAADPQDHPFAALKTLKIDPEQPEADKPKRK
jgi:uncharacterized metal-binding protein YceD (DUF177 family)